MWWHQSLPSVASLLMVYTLHGTQEMRGRESKRAERRTIAMVTRIMHWRLWLCSAMDMGWGCGQLFRIGSKCRFLLVD